MLLYFAIILIPIIAILAGALGLDAVVSNIRIAPLIFASLFFLGSALSCLGYIYHTDSKHPDYYIPRVLALLLFSFVFVWNFGSLQKVKLHLEEAKEAIFVGA
ncbi:MAG: hypothetical protein KDE05_05200 [Parvularculaceae bacterium]|nr:hypothetical protein [Parvularculaceae bacterium]